MVCLTVDFIKMIFREEIQYPFQWYQVRLLWVASKTHTLTQTNISSLSCKTTRFRKECIHEVLNQDEDDWLVSYIPNVSDMSTINPLLGRGDSSWDVGSLTTDCHRALHSPYKYSVPLVGALMDDPPVMEG